MAGPCSVESEEQIKATTAHVASHGASLFRGNILKPRTSFYEFYGVEEGRLELIRQAADKGDLKVAIEVTDVASLGYDVGICGYPAGGSAQYAEF